MAIQVNDGADITVESEKSGALRCDFLAQPSLLKGGWRKSSCGHITL
jgi:hypothetical protein